MTTSYTVTGDQVIAGALRKLGAIDLAETVDATTTTNCLLQLNLMLKQWQAEGIKLWTITELTLPLVAAQTTYTMGPSGQNLTTDKPLKLVQCFLRNTSVTPNIDMPMQILSRQEYNTLGSKASTGLINSVYFEPGVLNSTITVFLTPDTVTAAGYVLHMVVQQGIADQTTSGAAITFPNEWFNAIVWGLADQLAIEYSVPSNHRQEIMLKAEKFRIQLVDWDVENTSIFFQPDMRMSAFRR
jgi:hypothetical protein